MSKNGLRLRDAAKLWMLSRQSPFGTQPSEETHELLLKLFPGAQGTPPKRTTGNYLKGYSTMPWMHAIVSKLSNSIAKTTWQLFGVKDSRGKWRKHMALQQADHDTRKEMLAELRKEQLLVEIDRHPFHELIYGSSGYITGYSNRQLMSAYLDLVGEDFHIYERNNLGVPVGIWPIPGNWIKWTPTPKNPVFNVNIGNQSFDVPASEMLWMSQPDPFNPYTRGVGTSMSLADEFDTDEFASKHIRAFFYNRAHPDILVMPSEGGQLDEKMTRRMEEDWKNRNQGFWRQFRPHFMSRRVDVKVLSQTFEQMQVVDLRRFERETFISVFGLPPEVFGIIENSNRATIDASGYLYALFALVPRLEFLRENFQNQIIPQYDDRLIVDYISPVQEDKEFLLEAAKAAPWASTIDEWRQLQGQPVKEDGSGDLHMVPANLFPMDLGDSGGSPRSRGKG